MYRVVSFARRCAPAGFLVLALAAVAPSCAQAADASAPLAVPPASLAAANRLVRLHGLGRLDPMQRDAAATAAVGLVVRQTLRQLDPEQRLTAENRQTLAERLRTDMTPDVRRALEALRPEQLASSVADTMAHTLTPSQLQTLTAFYASPAGLDYLRFSSTLDALVAQGVTRLGSAPFSFNRSQTPQGEVRRSRQALLAMSTAARQVDSASHNGAAGAAYGLISELLTIEAGPGLDRLAARYRSRLPAFVAFQQGEAARAENLALRRWQTDSLASIAPALTALKQAQAARLPAWQELTRQLLASQQTSGH